MTTSLSTRSCFCDLAIVDVRAVRRAVVDQREAGAASTDLAVLGAHEAIVDDDVGRRRGADLRQAGPEALRLVGVAAVERHEPADDREAVLDRRPRRSSPSSSAPPASAPPAPRAIATRRSASASARRRLRAEHLHADDDEQEQPPTDDEDHDQPREPALSSAPTSARASTSSDRCPV